MGESGRIEVISATELRQAVQSMLANAYRHYAAPVNIAPSQDIGFDLNPDCEET